jgi:AraC-like DNA-binding protein
MCTKGRLHIVQDDRLFTVKKNQFIILFAGYEHYGYKECGEVLSYNWCHFRIQNNTFRIIRDDELTRIFDIKNHVPPDGGGEKHFSEFYVLPEYGEILSNGRAILLFHQLLDIARKDCYSGQFPNYALSLLAMEISQEFVEVHIQDRGRERKPKMEKIIEWIRVNYNVRTSLEEIARIFSYNPDYLSTAFRRYTGYSLMKYISKVRIMNAKKMLLNTGDEIKQIAYKVGFDDEKAFMKRFKQFEDITPTTYRNAFNRVKIVR